VVSNVISVYARSDAVVTLMLALDSRWGAVQSWLPQVALQALNTGPNPFGRTAMSAGILKDTVRQREAYGQYLSWSQANWAGVVAQQAALLDRQVPSSNSTFDPRTPSDSDWRRVQR
jgi:hypothetical protein